MNKSTIFKKAHSLTKAKARKGQAYREVFSHCLKKVYAAFKAESLKERMIDAGGKLWEGYGKSRIYFNQDEICELINVRIAYYGTGNISTAFKNDEAISNSEARRFLNGLGKVFFDLDNNKTVVDSSQYANEIEAAIAAL